MKLHRAFCCLRPSSTGVWTVQNDTDHIRYGIHTLGNALPTIIQTNKSLRVYFDPVFVAVGAMHVTTDDGFAGSVIANGSFGLQVSEIFLRVTPNLRACDNPIDPAEIWDVLAKRVGQHATDNGNLWCSFEGWIAD